MKKISLILCMLCLVLPIALADNTRVSGDISLVWSNAYDRPQQFVGTVTGDLAGDITLTTNTDYDATASNVGVTWSDDVELITDDYACEGFYAGSNVNAGRNAGIFSLACDDGNLIQGQMHGVNDAVGNMEISYSGLIITPTPGPQGLPGADGLNGLDGVNGVDGQDGLNGIDGTNGADGADGKSAYQSWLDLGYTGSESDFIDFITGPAGPAGNDGLNGADGVNGINGLNGVDGAPGLDGQDGINGLDGAQGPKGDTGLTGPQGEQGIQGLKGDTGNTGATGAVGPQGPAGTPANVTQINSMLSALNFLLGNTCQYGFNWTSFSCNGAPYVCTANALTCSGNNQMKCVANAWTVNQVCTNGCNVSSNSCNVIVPTTDNCQTLKNNASKLITCPSTGSWQYTKIYTGACLTGQGTSTACNVGKCQTNQGSSTYCTLGCNATTNKCNVPDPRCGYYPTTSVPMIYHSDSVYCYGGPAGTGYKTNICKVDAPHYDITGRCVLPIV